MTKKRFVCLNTRQRIKVLVSWFFWGWNLVTSHRRPASITFRATIQGALGPIPVRDRFFHSVPWQYLGCLFSLKSVTKNLRCLQFNLKISVFFSNRFQEKAVFLGEVPWFFLRRDSRAGSISRWTDTIHRGGSEAPFSEQWICVIFAILRRKKGEKMYEIWIKYGFFIHRSFISFFSIFWVLRFSVMQCGSWASCFRQALCGLHGSSGVDPLRSLWREVRSFRRSNSQNVDSTCNNEIMLFPDTEIVEDTWRDRSVWVEKTASFCIAGNSKKSVPWRTERNVVRSPIKKRLGGHMSHMSHMSHSDHIRPHTIHQKTWFANHMFNHSIYILSSKSRSHFKMFLNPILSVIFYNTPYRASQTEKWEERKFGSLVWGQKLGHSPWFVWEQIRFSFPDFLHIWCIWCVCAFCCKSSNFCGRSMSAKTCKIHLWYGSHIWT